MNDNIFLSTTRRWHSSISRYSRQRSDFQQSVTSKQSMMTSAFNNVEIFQSIWRPTQCRTRRSIFTTIALCWQAMSNNAIDFHEVRFVTSLNSNFTIKLSQYRSSCPTLCWTPYWLEYLDIVECWRQCIRMYYYLLRYTLKDFQRTTACWLLDSPLYIASPGGP